TNRYQALRCRNEKRHLLKGAFFVFGKTDPDTAMAFTSARLARTPFDHSSGQEALDLIRSVASTRSPYEKTTQASTFVSNG
ncbi:hypothetical protein, partial [Pseudomonas viridiflava]|uniref:hypothetical protein n=1 Tax=Pseudomonas viridiflava TaxID=33069 RepID=UPI0019CF762B